MNWIILSTIMFFSSIVYYLSIKKAQILGIDSKIYMVVNFFIPTLFYLFLAYKQGISLFVPPMILLGIIITRGIINYYGSIAGFMGMKEAPNSGYSVIIQKSYSVFTSISAVFLFHSELSLLNIWQYYGPYSALGHFLFNPGKQ